MFSGSTLIELKMFFDLTVQINITIQCNKTNEKIAQTVFSEFKVLYQKRLFYKKPPLVVERFFNIYILIKKLT